MKNLLKPALAVFLLVATGHANAVLVNLQEMANSNEAGWQPLVIENIAGFATFNLTINGYGNGGAIFDEPKDDAYAYLDKGDAGLGVCKKVTGSMQCDPGSDDNVSDNEWLEFVFTFKGEQVELTGIQFTINNNHDGGSLAGTTVFMDTPGGINNWDAGADAYTNILGKDSATYTFLDASSTFYIGHGGNDLGKRGNFYVEFIDIAGVLPASIEVPEPKTLMLLSIFLLGGVISRKRVLAKIDS